MKAKSSKELTSSQCRMARAGLRWGVLDLAERAQVGKTTIVRFENDQSGSNPSTRAALRQAFEEEGVEFIGNYGVHLQVEQTDAGEDE